MRTSPIVSAFFLVLALCLPVQAMDRWEALAQIESGNNDSAVGSAGEISRYQIKPRIWQHYAGSRADWQNQRQALSVAKELMNERAQAFERAYGRPPTDFEFYILWNAPNQIQRPSKAVAQRAQRFANLVHDR